jgi:pSer/pThr/pTyr-binding forkhead associated (FHA) protein
METQSIRLTLLQPNLAPQRIDAIGPNITLGRATECTVPIRDRYLSRKHAELIYSAGQWTVRDCGSVA